MLGKVEGGRRRGQQRMRGLDEASVEPCSVVSRCLVMTEGSPQKEKLIGGLYQLANTKRHPTSL